MNTGIKVALGAGLIGTLLYWLTSSKTTIFGPEEARQDLTSSSKELANFLTRSGGLDMRPDPANDPTDLRYLQRRFVALFQRRYNLFKKMNNIPTTPIREDGFWDANTAQAFKETTGYIPPQKYGTVF